MQLFTMNLLLTVMKLESIIKTFSITDLNNRVKANWHKNATIYYEMGEFNVHSNGTCRIS